MRSTHTHVISACTLVLLTALLGGCSWGSRTPSDAPRTDGRSVLGTAGVEASSSLTGTSAPGGSRAATGVPGGAGDSDRGAAGAPVAGDSTSGSVGNPETNLGTDVLVYVTTSARTNPPRGTEVTLGKSSFKPATGRMMDRGTVGPLRGGESATLVVYPDGKDGKRIEIAVRVPANSDANPRARIVDVAISDDTVTVLGDMVLPDSRGAHRRF